MYLNWKPHFSFSLISIHFSYTNMLCTLNRSFLSAIFHNRWKLGMPYCGITSISKEGSRKEDIFYPLFLQLDENLVCHIAVSLLFQERRPLFKFEIITSIYQVCHTQNIRLSQLKMETFLIFWYKLIN